MGSSQTEHDLARLVTIRSVRSLPEALVARSYLEANGIVVAFNGYHHAAMNWALLFALQGVRIGVIDTQREQAVELLKVTEHIPDEDPPLPLPTCSQMVVAVIAFVLTTVPFPFWLRHWRLRR